MCHNKWKKKDNGRRNKYNKETIESKFSWIVINVRLTAYVEYLTCYYKQSKSANIAKIIKDYALIKSK